MRIRSVGVLVLTALAVAAGQPERGAALARAAREAIGGEAKVRTVRSLRLEGHTRNLIGSTGRLSEPRPLEIRILLPDHYLRVVNRGTNVAQAGFARSTLLNAVRAVRAGDQFGASYGPEQIDIERTAFARMMLALLAGTTPVLPLQTRAATNDTIEFIDADGFSAFLDLDSRTRRPRALRHAASVHFPVPGSRMPPAPEQAEVVWSLEDHRDVSGVLLPHRIRRSARDVTLEEMRFDTIQVNPPLSATDFRD